MVREDAQLATRIERPRDFAAPSFVAMLMMLVALQAEALANGNGDAIRCGQPHRA